jgi:hypothetical protein
MMQRAVYALVAILSLFAANLKPIQAQSQDDSVVTPQSTPTNIDEVVRHSDSGENGSGAEAMASTRAYYLAADQSVQDLYLRDRNVVLAGHVEHDVIAVNCAVTVKPGAAVGGYLNVIGGTVDNQAGDAVHVIRQDSGLAFALGSFQTAEIGRQAEPARPLRRGEWPGSQLYLALVGLLGGLVLFVVGPRATQRTSDIVAIERSRSMAIGVIGAGVIVLTLLFGSLLFKSPLHVLAAPFVVAVAFVCAAILGFGWLCGMAYVGEALQSRLRHRVGSWYGQMAWGLLAFFLLNTLLGVLNPFLGGVGLFFETLFALMGLGAALISGFGADTNWLSLRLNREASWFSRSTRRR